MYFGYIPHYIIYVFIFLSKIKKNIELKNRVLPISFYENNIILKDTSPTITLKKIISNTLTMLYITAVDAENEVF